MSAANQRFSFLQLISRPSHAFGFLVAVALLFVSLYPLYIMLRTSFQSVGDPLQGAPEEIAFARANTGGLTVQNQPMSPGVWISEEGFVSDASAWTFEEDFYSADKIDAAFSFVWDGDLRLYKRLEFDGSGSWEVAWQDTGGNVAFQPVERTGAGQYEVRPQGSIRAGRTTGNALDQRNLSGFALIAREAHSSWESITLIPKSFTFANYVDVWQSDNFSRYTLNSFIVSIIVTLGSIATSLCAGYAFARGQLRGKAVLWTIMLGSMLIPVEVLLVPAFLIFQHFPLMGGNNILGQGGIGLLDSYAGLTLPNLVTPVGIFLVRQSFLSLPDSYEESAVLDGASIPQILWHVVAPLQRPILATVGLLTFLFSWNAFVFPLIIIQSPEMRTLPVGLALYSEKNVVDWVHLMAAAAMTAIPIFVLFVLFNRQLIAGLIHDGVKG